MDAKPGHERELLSAEEIGDLAMTVPRWSLAGNAIEREFRLKDFREAIDFVNKIAEIAETMDHHPDICMYYNKVHLKLTTHKAGGLTHEDFELAASIDRIQSPVCDEVN